MDRLIVTLLASTLVGCGARVSPELPLTCDGPASHLGCEFWATSTLSAALHEGFVFGVAVSNPSNEEARVEIQGGRLSAPIARVVAPRASAVIDLPWIFDLSGHESNVCGVAFHDNPPNAPRVAQGSYRITSNRPVSVTQYSPLSSENHASELMCSRSFSRDSSLLWPTRALGQRYRIAPLPEVPLGPSTSRAFVTVIGTRDRATSVTLDGSAMLADPDRPGMFRRPPYRFSLRRGEAMQFALSGGETATTSIESDGPIAVFSGHDCVRIPADFEACDHIEEQARPVDSWGREYAITPLQDRLQAAPVLVRFVAGDAPVQLSFDGIRPPAQCSSLAARAACEFETSDGFSVRGTSAFLAEQYTRSLGAVDGCAMQNFDDRRCFGDPSMLSITASELFLSEYHFTVIDPMFDSSVAITAPAGTTILLDGSPVSARALPTGAGWAAYHVRVSLGDHAVTSSDGARFGLALYGSSFYSTYASSAGAAVSPR
ncbi:MAG: IgGFc-binding protein [Polyangiales bacterium]